MTKEEFIQCLPLYVNGSLPPRRQGAVEGYLERHPESLHLLEEWRVLADAVREENESLGSPPASVLARTLAHIRAEHQESVVRPLAPMENDPEYDAPEPGEKDPERLKGPTKTVRFTPWRNWGVSLPLAASLLLALITIFQGDRARWLGQEVVAIGVGEDSPTKTLIEGVPGSFRLSDLDTTRAVSAARDPASPWLYFRIGTEVPAGLTSYQGKISVPGSESGEIAFDGQVLGGQSEEGQIFIRIPIERLPRTRVKVAMVLKNNRGEVLAEPAFDLEVPREPSK